MAERIKVLLSEEEVDRRIQEIGEQISRDYEGKQVHLVCVLKGGSFFMFRKKRKNWRRLSIFSRSRASLRRLEPGFPRAYCWKALPAQERRCLPRP